MREKHMPNPLTWVQISWALAGLALLTAALHVYNVPDNRLTSVASHLGVAMLLAGCINLVVYYFQKDKIHGSHWLLADGMTSLLLSIFPLLNQMILPAVIPFFFGIWELFSGIIKFVEATELHEEKIRGWRWFLLIGMFELVSGIGSMVKPIDDYVGMNHVISIILLVQSFGYIFKMLIYHNLAGTGSMSWLHRKHRHSSK
jgi:uncharacterized membrane protein HdeD (DUF308 family)